MGRFTRYFGSFLLCFNIYVYNVCGGGFKFETIEEPEKCDKMSKNGDYLRVHYTGTLQETGKEFDSSHARGEPFEFQLGVKEVVEGWDMGLQNMCVGEKRKLTVPPRLGYGETGLGDTVPGGATLEFDVELMSIEDSPKPSNVFKEIDTNEDGLLSQDEVGVFLKRQMGGAGAAMGGNPDMMENMVKEFMRIQDKNKNGKLNSKEFGSPTHGTPKDEL